jgi:putative ABC transport system substrate-binding protein
MPDTFMTVNRNLIIKLVTQNRTPAIYPFRYFVADGGMLSYGVNTPDILRRSAEYISRIIKGEKPADLPVQAPVHPCARRAIRKDPVWKTAKILRVELRLGRR